MEQTVSKCDGEELWSTETLVCFSVRYSIMSRSYYLSQNNIKKPELKI